MATNRAPIAIRNILSDLNEIIQKAIQQTTNINTIIKSGDSYFCAGQNGEALIAANRAIKLSPQRYEGYALASLASLQLGQFELASTTAATALQLGPDSKRAVLVHLNDLITIEKLKSQRTVVMDEKPASGQSPRSEDNIEFNEHLRSARQAEQDGVDLAPALAPADRKAEVQSIYPLLSSIESNQPSNLDHTKSNVAQRSSADLSREKLELGALKLIVADADAAQNKNDRQKYLEEYLVKSKDVLAEQPGLVNVWATRAAIGLELDNPGVAWEAGRRLLTITSDINGPVEKVLVQLERKGWLKAEPPPEMNFEKKPSLITSPEKVPRFEYRGEMFEWNSGRGSWVAPSGFFFTRHEGIPSGAELPYEKGVSAATVNVATSPAMVATSISQEEINVILGRIQSQLELKSDKDWELVKAVCQIIIMERVPPTITGEILPIEDQEKRAIRESLDAGSGSQIKTALKTFSQKNFSHFSPAQKSLTVFLTPHGQAVAVLLGLFD